MIDKTYLGSAVFVGPDKRPGNRSEHRSPSHNLPEQDAPNAVEHFPDQRHHRRFDLHCSPGSSLYQETARTDVLDHRDSRLQNTLLL